MHTWLDSNGCGSLGSSPSVCIGVPGRVLEVVDSANKIANVEVKGVSRKISLALLPLDEQVGPGDLVLIQMGYAMSRMTEAEAAEANDFLEGFGEALDRAAGEQTQRVL